MELQGWTSYTGKFLGAFFLKSRHVWNVPKGVIKSCDWGWVTPQVALILHCKHVVTQSKALSSLKAILFPAKSFQEARVDVNGNPYHRFGTTKIQQLSYSCDCMFCTASDLVRPHLRFPTLRPTISSLQPFINMCVKRHLARIIGTRAPTNNFSA